MQHRPAWAPDKVDIERPSVARMYDYFLQGRARCMWTPIRWRSRTRRRCCAACPASASWVVLVRHEGQQGEDQDGDGPAQVQSAGPRRVLQHGLRIAQVGAQETVGKVEAVYSSTSQPGVFRSRARVLEFFAGY